MTRIRIYAILSLALMVAPLAAEPLPPGLQSARLLPGWRDDDGNRIAALELRLQPGWKTYWRSPGDSGLPPRFDWQGSDNLADVTFHWPTPEAIRSGGDLTLGYHDTLVLPFTARPLDPDQPITLDAAVDFGLCENICVPAHVTLLAPEPQAAPDPIIEAALERAPRVLSNQPTCTLSEIADGMQLSVTLPPSTPGVVAMEVSGHPDIWVSSAEIARRGTELLATSDFVAPSAAPFDLDPSAVVITLIGPDGGTEIRGCDPQG